MNSSSHLWFDAECAAARKEYLNLRNRLSRKTKLCRNSDVQVLGIDDLRSEFVTAVKKYKQLLRYK